MSKGRCLTMESKSIQINRKPKEEQPFQSASSLFSFCLLSFSDFLLNFPRSREDYFFLFWSSFQSRVESLSVFLEPKLWDGERQSKICCEFKEIRKIVTPLKNWSGQRDSNPRLPAPKAGALPDCAMPRHQRKGTVREKYIRVPSGPRFVIQTCYSSVNNPERDL